MILETRLFDKKYKEKLKKIRAIVLHGADFKGLMNPEIFWNWINKSDNTYHYIISGDRIIKTSDESRITNHCDHYTYRKKARLLFKTILNKYSPNHFTISILVLKDKYNGAYSQKTMDTLIYFLAEKLFQYDLDPQKRLLRHSDITNEGRIKCPEAFFEDDDDPDDLWNSFKHWVDSYEGVIYKDRVED